LIPAVDVAQVFLDRCASPLDRDHASRDLVKQERR
jgi:hypothetical protein